MLGSTVLPGKLADCSSTDPAEAEVRLNGVFVFFRVFLVFLYFFGVFKDVLVLYSVFKGVLVLYSVLKGVLVNHENP